MLSAVATDGTAEIGLLAAVAGALVYVVIASLTALAVFSRRDVTA